MGYYCCVPFCKTNPKNASTLKVSFHEIPCNEELRKRWLLNIHRKNWQPGDSAKLCSLHFLPDDFMNGLKIRRLKKDAIPTVFPEYPEYLQIAARKRKLRNAPKIRPPLKKKIPTANFKPKTSNVDVSHQISGCEQLQEIISITEVHELTTAQAQQTNYGSKNGENCEKLEHNDSQETNNRSENLQPGHNDSHETNNALEIVHSCHNYSQKMNSKIELMLLDQNESHEENSEPRNARPDNYPARGRPSIKPDILKKKLRSLQTKNAKLQRQLNEARAKITEEKEKKRSLDLVSVLDEITADAASGSLQSIFLLDQLKAYKFKRGAKWSTPTLQNCVLWRMNSPSGYNFVKKSHLIKLPSKTTLQRYLSHGVGAIETEAE